MNRRERARLAHIALVMWSPFDRPQVSEENSSSRAEALRKWRGQQDEGEENENQQELSDRSNN